MFTEKITLLNQTVIECFGETDENKIIKSFTDVGIKVLEANYGFVWLNSVSSNKLELVYKTSNLPFKPKPPREKGRNYKVLQSSNPDFESDVENSSDAKYLKKYIKSFVIIPIVYSGITYGNLVLCFKKKENFSDEKRILSVFIGNNLAQAIKIHRLIDSEYQARALTEQNEAYFRALIKNSHETIILIDEKGKIMYTSSSVVKIFGLEPKDITNINIKKLVYKEDLSVFEDFLKNVIASTNIEHIAELRYQKKNNGLISLEFTGLNMLKNPSIKAIVVEIRDVTARKESQILKEKEIILEEEKIKTEFIANATHELRTPLAIIKGNVDLAMRNGAVNAKYTKTALKDIGTEIDHLSKMLTDLTFLTVRDSKLKRKLHDKKAQSINLDEVDLSNAIKNAVNSCQYLSSERKIKIHLSQMKGVKVLGSVNYLEKLFTIIINNGILHGKENGKVSISGKVNKDTVDVFIEDNGVGIPEDDLPYIFDTFYKVDRAHTGIHEGTGLGLAIAKWIIRIHKGDITVNSKVDEGTTFKVSLPLLK